MKYIIIPLIKFIYAISTAVLGIPFIVFVQIVYVLWTFKLEWVFGRDFWEHDSNPSFYEGTTLYDPKLVYKTSWHWLFNGNFKNFD